MTPIFHGKIEGSLLVWDNPSKVREYLITLEGKRFDATIRKERSQRSTNQNNYYFGVVCKVLGDYFGYEVDEIHFALRNKFLKKGACDLETARSTTSLSTLEFEEYLEKIKRWAASEYSVVIPNPNEYEGDYK